MSEYSKEDFEAEQKMLEKLSGKRKDYYQLEVERAFPDLRPDVIRYVGGYKEFMWLPEEYKNIFASGGWVDLDSNKDLFNDYWE